jgi:hypothetical protein
MDKVEATCRLMIAWVQDKAPSPLDVHCRSNFICQIFIYKKKKKKKKVFFKIIIRHVINQMMILIK